MLELHSLAKFTGPPLYSNNFRQQHPKTPQGLNQTQGCWNVNTMGLTYFCLYPSLYGNTIDINFNVDQL